MSGVKKTAVRTVEAGRWRDSRDEIAAEEPMEVRVVSAGVGEPGRHSVAVTMRTPGHDFELAAGFLYSEGLLQSREELERLESVKHNVVDVHLSPEVSFDPARYTRNVYTTSSCGICGKASLEMVTAQCRRPPVGDYRLNGDYFAGLPAQLAGQQTLFARTGGLHASALFDREGRLLLAREDVGRHNALDKVVGALFLEDALPASDTVILVSGRASFELVQKALLAGIPTLAAVGAPSSLAVELALRFDMTLIGFLRPDRFNVYSGGQRLVP